MKSPLSLARWSAKVGGRPAPRVPEGVVLYAIGDIHGRADLLEALIATVLQDAPAQALVVALGDYVDRGPESRRVVDLLLELRGRAGVGVRLLRGNHDQSLLDFLADPDTGPQWCRFGGRQTLFSYGVEPPSTRTDMGRWRDARDSLLEALPAAHLAFFRELELCFTCGDYFFAHAGARPDAALHRQSARDLMWIRAPFLEGRERLEKVVVHGHTPAREVHADHRRIGLDTGAYDTGVLSACRFEGDSRRLLQARDRRGGAPEILWRPL